MRTAGAIASITARRLPGLGVLAAVALSVVASTIPGLGAALVFDRQAIAAGEVWRLVTGHLVHFGLRHLLTDSGSLCLLVFAAWHWFVPDLDRVCLLAALASGLGVYLASPQFEIFGGLSGVAVAAWVHIALHLLAREARPVRLAGGMALALAACKLGLESISGAAVLGPAHGPYGLAVASHLAGAASAVAYFSVAQGTARTQTTASR